MTYVVESGKRLERSEAVERLERLERAAVAYERSGGTIGTGLMNALNVLRFRNFER